MAACFSSAGVFAMPTVYVFSRITHLYDCLCALPGLQFKNVELPDLPQETLSDDHISEIKNAEIGIFDPDSLMSLYKYMPNLKWAHSTWAGIDPLTKLTEQPPFVITRHVSDSFSTSMAEYVVCHIINFERKFQLYWKSQQTKAWPKYDEFFSKSRNLDELTVAILGVGNMGSAVAKFLRSRGATVFGLARNSHHQNQLFDRIFTTLDVLQECDYICNTLPHTTLTQGLLNNSVLKNCTKKPVFINVGRGSIISENELVHALKAGWLSGAVLDVFENEPLPKCSELWNMEQVTITPHVAAISKPVNIAEDFHQNITRYVDGHGLKNIFDWSAGY